jgi:hypothetical protein
LTPHRAPTYRGASPQPPRSAGGFATSAPRASSRRIAYAALLVAAGLTGAYAESIPNFEILTLTAFSSGVLLGARDGAVVGGFTMLVFTLLNPYGPAHPAVMAAQVLGMAVAGLGGAVFAGLGLPARAVAWRAAALVTAAIVITAAFDLATNAASGLVYGQVVPWIVAGIPFSLMHVGYNAALFAAVGTPLVPLLARYAARLGP